MGGLLYGEYDNTGALIREYVYLNGEPLAQIDKDINESLTYLHTDHLGTPRIGSNASGLNVWTWDSDAFGNGAPTGTATINLRFAGQYWDEESELHYNWNRYYDPKTGRYTTSDPIGLSGGLNTFAYVGANPVMYIDPEGLQSVIAKRIPILGPILDICLPSNPTCATHPEAFGGECEGNVSWNNDATNQEKGEEGGKDDGTSDEIAPEKDVKNIGRKIGKELGKDKKREFHDKKRKGDGDRSWEQIIEDAEDIYDDANADHPDWLDDLKDRHNYFFL